MSDTIIDLIRHGEPVGGRAYRGNRIDDPLSEKGWQQMWGTIGDNAPWSSIITSPLLRCQAFADSVAEKYNIPVVTEERFKEVGFGCWEGLTPKEIIATRKQEYDDFYRDPVNLRPDGAEPLDKFIGRTVTAYQEMVKQFSGQHLLVVAHAGVIRSIIAHTLHSQPIGLYRIKVNNAGMSRIRYQQKNGILEFHNTTLAAMR